jgi:hypothetical protein
MKKNYFGVVAILLSPFLLMIASACLGKIHSLMQLRFNLPPIDEGEFNAITALFLIFCLMFKGLLWTFSPQGEKK